MESKWFERPWANYVPLIMLGIFLVFYLFTELFFLECRYGELCQKIEPTYVFTKAKDPEAFDKTKKITLEEQKSLLTTADQTAIAKRYRGRLIWTFVMMTTVLCSLFALFFFYTIIKKSAKGIRYFWFTIVIGLLVSIAAAWGDSMPLVKSIFVVTIQDSFGGMTQILNIIKAINVIVYTSIIVAVFTNYFILCRKYPENAGTEQKLKVLSEMFEDVRAVLYVCTALLVVGILRITASNNWNLSFISPESSGAATIYFYGVTTMLGGFFSSLLAANFLPPAYIMRQRAKSLLQNSGLILSAQEEKLKSAGLSISFGSSLPRLAAIIAPLLTGQIADLVNTLSSLFAH